MDINPVGQEEYKGQHPDFYGKNSREQWKYDHQRTMFGGRDPKLTQHQVEEKVVEKPVVRKDEMRVAGGGKSWDKTNQMSASQAKHSNNYSERAYTNQNGPKFEGLTDEQLFEKVRTRILARGARGLIGLGKSFSIMDDDGSGDLSTAEFTKALTSYRISQDPLEINAIFNLFDVDKNGGISYNEFLRGIAGEMNSFRRGLAMKAFKKLDKDGNGVIQKNDLKGVYNAKMHPDVRLGKMTEDDVLFEFLDTFEQ